MLESALADLARCALFPVPGQLATRGRMSRRGLRFGSRRITVVLGPAWAQVRVLEGLPPLDDARRIESLVQLNHDAFFPRRGAGAPAIRVARRDNVTIGVAYDHGALAAAVNGLRHGGCRVAYVLPTPCALPAVVRNGEIDWCDADDQFRLAYNDGFLTSISRSTGDAIPNEYDDAVAAALLDRHRRVPLAWRSEPTAAAARRRRIAEIAASAATCVLSLALAASASGLRARHDIGANARALAVLQAPSVAASRMVADLRHARIIDDRAARFAAERGRVTLILADLARALPESTAIVMMRLDSLGGSFTIVGRGVTSVLPAISRVPNIADPRLVGSITRESGAAQLGRAAFRFRIR